MNIYKQLIMQNDDLIKTYTGPATYQITVDGKVNKEYLHNITGLSVSLTELKGHTISVLTGEILDQSALSGIINLLVDNRYSVITVIKIDN